jgi:hypothetical protein
MHQHNFGWHYAVGYIWIRLQWISYGLEFWILTWGFVWSALHIILGNIIWTWVLDLPLPWVMKYQNMVYNLILQNQVLIVPSICGNRQETNL